MKKILTICSLFCVLISSAQNAEIIDKKYFLLGTLSDNQGRLKYPEIKTQIDYYVSTEKYLALELFSMFKDKYPDLKVVYNNDSSNIVLLSGKISRTLNNYYEYQPCGHYTKVRSKKQYPIYCGSFKTDIFSNEIQRLSFLTGVYIRYSRDNDTTYCIELFNSRSKASLCYSLLKEIGCTNVVYDIQSDKMPVRHILYFKPTTALYKCLSEYNNMKKILP